MTMDNLKQRLDLIDMWNELMKRQADFSMPLELGFYYGLEGWLTAKDVIDLGSGNGSYIFNLIDRFPAKNYTLVEKNPDLATKGTAYLDTQTEDFRKNVSIVCAEINTMTGLYDLIIARLLVQYLKFPDEIFVIGRRLLNSTGNLVIIEADDSVQMFWPPTPTIEEFFRRFRQSRQAAGFDRDSGVSLVGHAPNHGFEVLRNERIIAPTTLRGGKDNFFKMYQLAVGIIKGQFSFEYRYEKVLSELRDWYSNPHSFAQIGFHMACYKPVK